MKCEYKFSHITVHIFSKKKKVVFTRHISTNQTQLKVYLLINTQSFCQKSEIVIMLTNY